MIRPLLLFFKDKKYKKSKRSKVHANVLVSISLLVMAVTLACCMLLTLKESFCITFIIILHFITLQIVLLRGFFSPAPSCTLDCTHYTLRTCSVSSKHKLLSVNTSFYQWIQAFISEYKLFRVAVKLGQEN